MKVVGGIVGAPRANDEHPIEWFDVNTNSVGDAWRVFDANCQNYVLLMKHLIVFQTVQEGCRRTLRIAHVQLIQDIRPVRCLAFGIS